MGISHQSKLEPNERKALQLFPQDFKDAPKGVASSMIERLSARGLIVEHKQKNWSEGAAKFKETRSFKVSRRGQRMLARYGSQPDQNFKRVKAES